MIVKCEHSALYCATQGHSILILRNTLPVWWRYELCEDTEASQCTLYAVKTKRIINKYFVSKSSFVCNMVKYIVEIILVWFQLFTWRLLVSGTKSDCHGSKWHEMSRNYELGCWYDVMLDVSLSRKFEAGLSLNSIKKYKRLCVHSVI